MKKHGFTLAEVLITLAIIGVVATITLPSLISNTQEQQAVTAFRKAMNTLNEVPQMNAAVDGFDYGDINSTQTPSADAVVYGENGLLTQSIWAMFASKAQVDATKSGTVANRHPGGCEFMQYVIAFRDGTMLCYQRRTTAGRGNSVIWATVDTNGIKAPNQMSTCGDVNCANKAQKNIRDQFAVTLYKSSAIPGTVDIDASGNLEDDETDMEANNAARWAMSK